MLKESNTFQQAAQEALGKTTAELVAMAKEGSLRAEQLTRIVLEMEKIGASEATADHHPDTLTQSFKNLFTTLSQGIGEAFDAGETKKIIDPDEISNAQKVMTVRTRQEIGGLLELALDACESRWTVAKANYWARIYSAARPHSRTGRTIRPKSNQGMTENWPTHWAQVKEGSVMGTWSDPNYGEEAKQAPQGCAASGRMTIAISEGKAKDALTP